MKIIRKPRCGEDLSGMAWVDRRTYELLGTPFAMRFQDVDMATQTRRLLSGFNETLRRARPADTFSVVADGTSRLYRDCRRLLTARPPGLLVRLLAEINRTAVERAPHFAVHAGLAGDDDRVFVIAAPSGGGKSTLTAALLLAGLRYGSDEALCLDDQGMVVPYPKPLSLTVWSRRALGLDMGGFEDEFPITASELGAGLLEEKRLPTDLILPERTEGRTSIDRLPPSEAMRVSLLLSLNHYVNPPRAFQRAAELARSVRTWRLRMGNPIEAAELLLGIPPGSRGNRWAI